MLADESLRRAGLVSATVIFRVQPTRLVVIAVLAFGILASLVTADDLGGGDPAVLMVVTGTQLTAFAALLLRALWWGVHLTDDGVRIVNLFRSVSLTWEEIASFEMDSFRLAGRPVAAVTTASGDRIRISSLAPVRPVLQEHDPDLERMLAQLNAEVARRHQAADPPSGPT